MSENPWERLLHHEEYTKRVGEVDIVIQDEVFAPDTDITYSSQIFLDHGPQDYTGKRVLDVGCGTGVLGINAVSRGALHATLADIDTVALENAKINVSLHHLADKIDLINSDVFEEIVDTYDIILANLPILDEVWESDEHTNTIVSRFIQQYQQHLNRDGKAYLAWGSFADITPVRQLLDELRTPHTEKSVNKDGFVRSLFELS